MPVSTAGNESESRWELAFAPARDLSRRSGDGAAAACVQLFAHVPGKVTAVGRVVQTLVLAKHSACPVPGTQSDLRLRLRLSHFWF